jgi:hypothetical protein
MTMEILPAPSREDNGNTILDFTYNDGELKIQTMARCLRR